MDIPNSELNRVMDPEVARRYYEDGARRWRKPRRKHPNGLDTKSIDFRGVMAAFTVTESLPDQYDKNDEKIPIDPSKVKEHYDIGLTAVRNAGLLPLDERFVEGYSRWANAIVDEATQLADKARNDSLAPHA